MDGITSVPVLEAVGLSKSFPGVLAVQDISIAIRPGEVHCLVGENGAGKSTMIKMMSGEYAPDGGEMRMQGQPVRFASPLDARRAGIAVIHQELQLVPEMSVAENIVLGRWPLKAGLTDRGAARRVAQGVLPRVGLSVNPELPVARLSVGQQQQVEIARALAFSARLLILDEPTASLSASEAARLAAIIRQMRADGLGILYVSHRLEEVFDLGDTVTVVRDGRHVATQPTSELDHATVVDMMVGGRKSLFVERDHRAGNVLLEVRGLSRRGAFQDVSFVVRQGEIVGFGGLVGAGRTEVARCIFGIDRADAGEIRIDGVASRISSPRNAIARGIALVPEDRKGQGLVLPLSVGANLEMSVLGRLSTAGWLHPGAEHQLIHGFIERLRVRTPSARQPVEALSGGNQQKVVIARWLATKPRLMILDEPTRGVDVGAKAEIHRLIEQFVREGLGVLLISSDLPELLAMSDRVYVMRAGRLVAELAGDQIVAAEVMRHAAGATSAFASMPGSIQVPERRAL
jgi:ABC-type sugar transport system ATPase subunit